MNSATKPESEESVCFDEDYKAMIWRLMEMIERERSALFDLREEIKQLRAERSGHQK